MTTLIETPRLIIKAPSIKDLDEWCKLMTDPEVMKYVGNGVRTRKETKYYLQIAIDHQKKHGFSLGSIYEKSSGKFIGRGGLIYLGADDSQPDIEIGYALHKAYWGKGYATEITKACIDWGFSHLSVKRLVAVTAPDNTASQRVLEKAGMHYAKDALYHDDPVKFYEISKKE